MTLLSFEAQPSIPRLVAKNLQDSHDQNHLAAVNQALASLGIVLVDLEFADISSTYLHDLVLGLGKHHNHGPPIEHSATRGWFWDVRPMEASTTRARSETNLNFPWHTDCSYETRPPQFFGLHVLHADQCGGGTFRALKAERILRKVSPSTYESLSHPSFRIKVPEEFCKGNHSIDGSVVAPAEEKGFMRIRFRSDIIQPLSTDAEKALQELNDLLAPGSEANIEDIGISLTPSDLPDNTVILMDNSSWLHSRTEVRDPQRHLRRLRWGRRGFECRVGRSEAESLMQGSGRVSRA